MSGQSHGPGGGDGAPGAPAGPSPTAQQPLEDEVLEILSSLIAFKNRADAKGWRDAFENMPVYMEVRHAPHAAAAALGGQPQ